MNVSVSPVGKCFLHMVMHIGNTAHMIAILDTDLEENTVTKEEGRREIAYQMTMNIAKKLMEEQMITREQYRRFDEIMQQKYKPIFGGLFTNLNLL